MPAIPSPIDLSLILPVYNEEDNLPELYQLLNQTLANLPKSYEIIFVDDGSHDNSFKILKELAMQDPHVKVIRFRRNFGQTAALSAGIEIAKGNILIPMDADLQNSPTDIPALLQKLDEGYDVVSGWRKSRHDPFWQRRLPSVIANFLISWLTAVHLHDYGCTLKVYRKEVIKDVKLYGEMHRFIPVYANMLGARVTELPVTHHPRKHGVSKYGIGRTFKVILDLIMVKFLSSYSSKPLYLFGGLGLLCNFAGVLSAVIVLFQKYVYGTWAHRNPLLLLSVFFFIVGMQIIMMGLLAELEIRTYHESQNKRWYVIQETVNLDLM